MLRALIRACSLPTISHDFKQPRILNSDEGKYHIRSAIEQVANNNVSSV